MTRSETYGLDAAYCEARRMAQEIGGDDLQTTEKTSEWLSDLSNRTEQTLVYLMYVITYGEGWTIGKLADCGFSLSLLNALQLMEMHEDKNLIDYIYRIKGNAQAENAFAAQATIRLFERMETSDLDLECSSDDIVSVMAISILNGYKFDASHEFERYKRWINSKSHLTGEET